MKAMSKSKTGRNLQNFQIKNKDKTRFKTKKIKKVKGFTSANNPSMQIICSQGHILTGRQRRPKKCPICGTKRFRNIDNTYDPSSLVGLAIFLPPFNSPFDL